MGFYSNPTRKRGIQLISSLTRRVTVKRESKREATVLGPHNLPFARSDAQESAPLRHLRATSKTLISGGFWKKIQIPVLALAGWLASWNDPMPGSSQVNITPILPGFSCPIGREKPPLVPKWSQLPRDGTDENLASDIDWRVLVNPDPAVTAPNWVLADDFRSDGRPILAVRWWGSYFNPENEPRETEPGVFVPAVEDGFVVSFFRDVPADQNPTGPFSQPGDLLGTYVAPVSAVRIRPTDEVGWDDHRIWEYEVELEWTHLEHAIPGLSEPDAFLEKEGEIYWLSILAENGHEIDMASWEVFPNDDPIEQGHYWGWHTSPDAFNDSATFGMLAMPAAGEWLYEQWNPVDEVVAHDLRDMSFELLTPEPSSVALFLLGPLALATCVRRRRQ